MKHSSGNNSNNNHNGPLPLVHKLYIETELSQNVNNSASQQQQQSSSFHQLCYMRRKPTTEGSNSSFVPSLVSAADMIKIMDQQDPNRHVFLSIPDQTSTGSDEQQEQQEQEPSKWTKPSWGSVHTIVTNGWTRWSICEVVNSYSLEVNHAWQ